IAAGPATRSCTAACRQRRVRRHRGARPPVHLRADRNLGCELLCLRYHLRRYHACGGDTDGGAAGARGDGGVCKLVPPRRFVQPTVWEKAMTILVIGGSGFIGYRLVRLLVARGETVFCMDADPAAHSFADLGKKVCSLRGDVARFEDVMRA